MNGSMTSTSREGHGPAIDQPPHDGSSRIGDGPPHPGGEEEAQQGNTQPAPDNRSPNPQRSDIQDRIHGTPPPVWSTTGAQEQRTSRDYIKIASLNIRGRVSTAQGFRQEKWFEMNRVMNTHQIAVLAVQETHLTDDLAENVERAFNTRLRLFLLSRREVSARQDAMTYLVRVRGLLSGW